MARKRIRRYRKKGRWSSNIKNVNNTTVQANVGTFYAYFTLTSNPAQSDDTVSQQYTVKNVEFSFQIETPQDNNQIIENITVYIMYLPQGFVLSNNLVNEHPEWIMAYRYLGAPDASINSSYRYPRKIKTRLSRRLQTGDSIILYLTGYNNSSSLIPVIFHGLIRWWTKAN